MPLQNWKSWVKSTLPSECLEAKILDEAEELRLHVLSKWQHLSPLPSLISEPAEYVVGGTHSNESVVPMAIFSGPLLIEVASLNLLLFALGGYSFTTNACVTCVDILNYQFMLFAFYTATGEWQFSTDVLVGGDGNDGCELDDSRQTDSHSFRVSCHWAGNWIKRVPKG